MYDYMFTIVVDCNTFTGAACAWWSYTSISTRRGTMAKRRASTVFETLCTRRVAWVIVEHGKVEKYVYAIDSIIYVSQIVEDYGSPDNKQTRHELGTLSILYFLAYENIRDANTLMTSMKQVWVCLSLCCDTIEVFLTCNRHILAPWLRLFQRSPDRVLWSTPPD